MAYLFCHGSQDSPILEITVGVCLLLFSETADKICVKTVQKLIQTIR